MWCFYDVVFGMGLIAVNTIQQNIYDGLIKGELNANQRNIFTEEQAC